MKVGFSGWIFENYVVYKICINPFCKKTFLALKTAIAHYQPQFPRYDKFFKEYDLEKCN